MARNQPSTTAGVGPTLPEGSGVRRNIARMADDICVIRSMQTDAINHEPANQLVYTGSMQNGKASLGSWLAYGLGSMNQDLPSFVVLHAKHANLFCAPNSVGIRRLPTICARASACDSHKPGYFR